MQKKKKKFNIAYLIIMIKYEKKFNGGVMGDARPSHFGLLTNYDFLPTLRNILSKVTYYNPI